MKQTWTVLKQMIQRLVSPNSAAELDPAVLKGMARGIMTTRPDEIDCAECFEHVDQFIEMKLAGKNAAEAMPLVQDHLDRCHDCREEFEALVTALQAMS